jgi:Domain of unknown function (DUF4062)
MSASPKLKLMIASTVYNFEDQLRQICAVLGGFGYDIWNSHIGTIPVNPKFSNLENCMRAARDCDLFLGIVRPFYGSGLIGQRSITHEEFRVAIKRKKPRWFLVHHDVTFTRQLLKAHMFRPNGARTAFKLKRNPVLDDLRVIDLYNDSIQSNVPPSKRKGHWTQEYIHIQEALQYIDSQFKDVRRIRRIRREMDKS